jgi:hypothetical protein
MGRKTPGAREKNSQILPFYYSYVESCSGEQQSDAAKHMIILSAAHLALSPSPLYHLVFGTNTYVGKSVVSAGLVESATMATGLPLDLDKRLF